MRTKVTTITCAQCGDEIYSRAHHDYHKCKCGNTMVDGGFDYLRYGWNPKGPKPEIRKRFVLATKRELYDDWNKQVDKFGSIARKR